MKTLDSNIVETAVLDFVDGNSEYKSNIAKLIMDEMSTKLYKKEAAPSIYHAIYKASLRNARFNQLEEAKCKEVDVSYKPELYNIGFYSFIQQIQDKVCWLARRGTKARLTVDQLEEEMLGGNGIDFATNLSEDLGVDTDTLANVRDDVLEVNRILSNVSSAISTKLNVNADPLYLFAPSTLVNDEWVQEVKTNDWDQALYVMDDIAEKLRADDKLTEADINEEIKFA